MCQEIAKSEQRIHINVIKKKFGKLVTIVSGFEKGIDMKKTAKELKEELGCGGTIREDKIELQGDHRKKIKPILVRIGFDEESIICE